MLTTSGRTCPTRSISELSQHRILGEGGANLFASFAPALGDWIPAVVNDGSRSRGRRNLLPNQPRSGPGQVQRFW
jgi:hypothetical protein